MACLKLSSLFALAGSNKKDKAEWTWSGLAELVKYSRVSSYSSLFLMVHLLPNTQLPSIITIGYTIFPRFSTG